MNIHEHQAKELLRRYGVAVPDGEACFTVDAAVATANRLGFPCVVKAQIHAGGRGKAGGVQVVRDAGEAEAAARTLLGKTLVTHQTGPQGRVVRRLLVERACRITRELYLGMVVDRTSGRMTVMASTEGGVEIEEVAARTPEKILRETIDPAVGFAAYQGRRLAFGLGLTKEQVGKAVGIIKAAGGMPANCLDVGGGATTEKVAAAFRILLSDAAVKAIFINIFGGILRCDVLADGVVQAAREVGLSIPLVVRMEGTNVDEGKAILAGSGLDIITARDRLDGARTAVAAAGRRP